MLEPMSPSDRKDLYIIMTIIIGVVAVILTIVGGIVWDALDTAHEEVENKFNLERLAVYERLISETGANPIAVECSINPPQQTNTAYYALCTIATGSISEEQLAEIGNFLPPNRSLGD